MASLERLREVLRYDAVTGDLVWIKRPSHHCKECSGEIAGSVFTNGYRYVQLDGRSYRAHRLCWMLHYGEEPPAYIDHVDRNKDNNRIANLRACDPSLNGANMACRSSNTSGVKGVRWEEDRQKWRAQIQVSGKSRNLGRYANLEDAMKAYERAAVEAFGAFAHTGYGEAA